MATRETIIEAACDTLAARGISGVTVARVAKAARVSGALVHYHFATKQRLLAAAAEQLAGRRTAGRMKPLRSRGLAALDALWLDLQAGVDRGAERAWHDLVLLAREDSDVRAVLARERSRERAATAAELPGLLASLGSRPSMPADELASVVGGFLDGSALALAAGVPRAEVRAAYDAFWLALVTLGQVPRPG